MKIFGTCLLLLAMNIAVVHAQTFDSSATGSLKGSYFVRQLLVSDLDPATGAIGRARSLLGTATLDGAGNYAISGTVADSNSLSGRKNVSISGTYQVAANGLAQMQNPLEPSQTVNGGVGLGAFVGSATETAFQDLLIMIPAGTGTGNSALQGSYRVGVLDFAQASAGNIRDAYFTLNAGGDGTIAPITLNGSAANQANAYLSQTITGSTYSVTGPSTGTITFAAAADSTMPVVSGDRSFYVSADRNLILGGSANGFDILVGVLASGETGLQGSYFAAGMDVNNSNPAIPVTDAFYGSFLAAAGGTNFWHQRLNPFNTQTYDYTFASSTGLDASGSATKTFTHYDEGAGGKAVLIVGRGSEYTLALGLHADTFSGTGVYLNPLGVVSAASFSPVTNSVAPNEIVSLFGTGLSSSTLAAPSLPLPSTLGGVQVTVNGRPARIFYISPTQINVLVPSNLPEDFATFQVTNNGVVSNKVTMYANDSAPGAFSQDASGLGPVAALHSDFSPVSQSHPAAPGETVQMYLSGLGNVSPAVADGSAGPTNPLSSTSEAVFVFIGGQLANVSFAGLAPGFAGVYQVNFQVPSKVGPGMQLISIDTPDAYDQQAAIVLAGASGASSSIEAVSAETQSYRPAPCGKNAPKVTRNSGGRHSTNKSVVQ